MQFAQLASCAAIVGSSLNYHKIMLAVAAIDLGLKALASPAVPFPQMNSFFLGMHKNWAPTTIQ